MPQHSWLITLYLGTVTLCSTLGGYYHTNISNDSMVMLLKNHPLNVYGVKLGWLWSSMLLALLLLYSTYRVHWLLPRKSQYRSRRAIRAAIRIACSRWCLATAYWILCTQWIPFAASNGLFHALHKWDPWAYCSNDRYSHSYQLCLEAGERWMGAIDVSGHCFLLCHASLTIWEELIIAWRYLDIINNNNDDGGVAVSRRQADTQIKRWELIVETVLAAGLIILLAAWLWMLIVTCLHFHSWLEKLGGTLMAFLYWRVTYAGGCGRHRHFHFNLTRSLIIVQK